MIIFVDNETEAGYTKPWGEKLMAARVRIKYRLEDISGLPCLIVRYNRMSPALVRDLGAQALFISGNSASPPDYDPEDLQGFQTVLQAEDLPVFGFCGGLQSMAIAYGIEVAPIGPLEPDEVEPEEAASFAPGMKKEFGYQPVRTIKDHPLLDGLGEAPIFRHAHAWELKAVPAGFQVYAATDVTPIQLLIHDQRPLVGTQFHPEYYTEEHPAGRTLIENFFVWAGLSQPPG